MASNRGRYGARYASRVKELKDSGEPCCLCRQPIDVTLRSPHPMSFSIEHTQIPVEQMQPGDAAMWEPWNTAPAHRTCNITAGNLARQGRTFQPPARVTSRQW